MNVQTIKRVYFFCKLTNIYHDLCITRPHSPFYLLLPNTNDTYEDYELYLLKVYMSNNEHINKGKIITRLYQTLVNNWDLNPFIDD